MTGPRLGIVVLYLVVALGIGLAMSGRASRSVSDYFVGSRALPWWLAGTSMVATTFAADTPLAVTEMVVQHGVAGNWLWWNMVMTGSSPSSSTRGCGEGRGSSPTSSSPSCATGGARRRSFGAFEPRT